MTAERTRVAIIDDHELFAQSLALALGMNGYETERLPVGRSAEQLLERTIRWKPSIVLLDLDLGAIGDASRLISPLVRSGATVIVLTASMDRTRHGECLAAGAAAVILKSGSLADIRAAVRRASTHRAVTDLEEREQLIRRWHQHRADILDARRRFDQLTERESEVLGHLIRGRTVSDIARLRVVSETTVRTQVKSVLAKLEVSSQIAAVGLARQVGWRPPPDVDAD